MTSLNPKTTALVLIDLQHGIVGLPLAPRTGPDVAADARALAARFRAAGAPVVLVHVGWQPDLADMLTAPVDRPMARPAGGLPANWSELVDDLRQPGDIVITKRQWGAFYGTELDLQLRRRGIETIVLAGIATNFGVESTARAAWEHGYRLTVVADLCSSMSAELHAFSIEHILPRIGHVTTAQAIAFAPAA
jgi:nicotinamidase-related amidase